jgi:pyruvate,orthophosphate dikinase
VGRVVFDTDRAVEWAKDGQQVILVRPETSPEDVAGQAKSFTGQFLARTLSL